VRMGAGPRRCSSPDIPDLARRMALQSLLPFLVGGRSSEDGDRRYVARSEQAARLARGLDLKEPDLAALSVVGASCLG